MPEGQPYPSLDCFATSIYNPLMRETKTFAEWCDRIEDMIAPEPWAEWMELHHDLPEERGKYLATLQLITHPLECGLNYTLHTITAEEMSTCEGSGSSLKSTQLAFGQTVMRYLSLRYPKKQQTCAEMIARWAAEVEALDFEDSIWAVRKAMLKLRGNVAGILQNVEDYADDSDDIYALSHASLDVAEYRRIAADPILSHIAGFRHLLTTLITIDFADIRERFDTEQRCI